MSGFVLWAVGHGSPTRIQGDIETARTEARRLHGLTGLEIVISSVVEALPNKRGQTLEQILADRDRVRAQRKAVRKEIHEARVARKKAKKAAKKAEKKAAKKAAQTATQAAPQAVDKVGPTIIIKKRRVPMQSPPS